MGIRLFNIERKDTLSHVIAQGGILAGITLLLASLGNVFPILELLQYLALSPIIIAGVLRGPLFSVEVAVASTILVSAFWGIFPSGVFFLFSTVPLGIALGHFFRKKASSRLILISSVAILSVSLGVLLYISMKFFGMDLQKDILAMARSFNMSSDRSIKLFTALLPSALFLTALCYSFYIWLFNAYVLARIGLAERKGNFFVDIFHFFQFPPSILLIFTGGLILSMTRGSDEFSLSAVTGLNILCCTSTLLYFRGIFMFNALLKGRLNRYLHLLLFLFCVTVGIPLMIIGGIIVTIVPLEFFFRERKSHD